MTDNLTTTTTATTLPDSTSEQDIPTRDTDLNTAPPSKKRKRVEEPKESPKTPPSPTETPKSPANEPPPQYYTVEDVSRIEDRFKALIQAQEDEIVRLRSHLKAMEEQMNKYVEAIKKRTGMTFDDEKSNTTEA